MTSLHCQSLFAVLLVFAFAQKGSCLKCYTCNSTVTNNCRDPFNSAQIKQSTCQAPNNVCLKQKQGEKGKEIVVNRGCVPERFCLLIVSEYCSLCETDLCNSTPASLYFNSTSIILISCILFLIIYV